MLRDVIFEAAASADLGPKKEESHLLPGTIARPGDVTIRRWSNGRDAAIDVTVTSPLAASNVEGAVEPGASLNKAVQRKLRDTEEACRQEGPALRRGDLGGVSCRRTCSSEANSCCTGQEQGL